MYTSGELERASMALDEPVNELENRIMSDIVRRIRANGEITSAADWQINRLVQLGMGMAEIQSAISEALGAAEDITDSLFTDVIRAGYVRDRKLYEAVGKVQIPFDDNEPLQQLISSVTAQTNETMNNITQSLGFAQRGSDGRISFTPIADYYQQTLDKAMLDISSGAFDYNTVLHRTVREMTNSGLRTVDYGAGWSNRTNVAARRAVMTGMTQLTAKVNEDNAEQLDTDWFEISWHSGARPSHWWGGKWYRKDQLRSICKLGDVQGLCGVNCYHDYSPVIPGVSEPTYTDEELAELDRREKEPVEYNGKKYTKYEALQRQRRLETTMRAQRQEMALLKEGGASEDDLINCRARYRGTSHEYAVFSKAMGLPQQRERVTVDGLGNIMQGKYTKGSGKPSPVSVPKVGAKREGKVTAEERKELLSRNPVNVHNSSVDKSVKSGIIEARELESFIVSNNGTEVPKDVKTAIKETVSVIPEHLRSRLEQFVPEIIVEEGRGFSSFTSDNNIILDKETATQSILHELGHAWAKMDNLYEDEEFLAVLADGLDREDWGEVTSYVHPYKQGDYVYILESPKFLTPYQGRVYSDFFDVDPSEPIPLELFQEYISVGFQAFFDEPELLRKKDKKLYEFLEASLNERS